MVHVVVLAEGYCDALDDFEKFFHGRTYVGGKAKVRMRELKLYTCSVNEVGKKEFLEDLRGFSHTGDNGVFGKARKWLQRFFGVMGLKKINIEDYESSGLRGSPDSFSKSGEACVSFNGHFVVLGEFADPRIEKDCNWGKKGEELV